MTTFETVREIICDQMGLEPDEITENASLAGDIQADSVDLLQIVFTLEETFPGVKFPLEDHLDLETVGDAVKYIEEHMDK